MATFRLTNMPCKECADCEEVKPMINFAECKISRDGRVDVCRLCVTREEQNKEAGAIAARERKQRVDAILERRALEKETKEVWA